MEKIRQETNCRVCEGMAKSLAGMSWKGPFKGRYRHLKGKTRSQPLKLEGGKGLWGISGEQQQGKEAPGWKDKLKRSGTGPGRGKEASEESGK